MGGFRPAFFPFFYPFPPTIILLLGYPNTTIIPRRGNVLEPAQRRGPSQTGVVVVVSSSSSSSSRSSSSSSSPFRGKGWKKGEKKAGLKAGLINNIDNRDFEKNVFLFCTTLIFLTIL